jgi:hypothetical protein
MSSAGKSFGADDVTPAALDTIVGGAAGLAGGGGPSGSFRGIAKTLLSAEEVQPARFEEVSACGGWWWWGGGGGGRVFDAALQSTVADRDPTLALSQAGRGG